MPETSYTDITDENAQYFLGLENLNGIDEALASDAVMRPVAHSVCLVRVSDGGDVEAIKEEIRAKVNPAKWICVGVSREDVIVESRGQPDFAGNVKSGAAGNCRQLLCADYKNIKKQPNGCFLL